MAETSNNSSTDRADRRGRAVKLVIITAFVAALAAIGGAALLVNIMERKQEARNPFYRVVELDDDTEDPAIGARTSPCSMTVTAGLWTR
jgi:nitrite reductase (cytochrome c-552)